MSITVAPGKTALSAAEAALIVEGLEAGAREQARMAADAQRLGYSAQAREFTLKAASFQSLARTARSVRISKITVRHS
jgi:hypothetical protein